MTDERQAGLRRLMERVDGLHRRGERAPDERQAGLPGHYCLACHDTPCRWAAARAPAQEERLRSLLTLAHDHHAFGPEHCTPANCSVSEALAEYRALGVEPKEEGGS